MKRIIDATYDGEVFRPDEPIDLPVGTKGEVFSIDEDVEKETDDLNLQNNSEKNI